MQPSPPAHHLLTGLGDPLECSIWETSYSGEKCTERTAIQKLLQGGGSGEPRHCGEEVGEESKGRRREVKGEEEVWEESKGRRRERRREVKGGEGGEG